MGTQMTTLRKKDQTVFADWKCNWISEKGVWWAGPVGTSEEEAELGPDGPVTSQLLRGQTRLSYPPGGPREVCRPPCSCGYWKQKVNALLRCSSTWILGQENSI